MDIALDPRGSTHLPEPVEARVLEPRYLSAASRSSPVSKKTAQKNAAAVRRDPAKEFVKLMNAFDHGRNPSEKFRDFCEMAYCATAKLTAFTKERADELEARYMRIVDRYQDKRIIRESFPHMMAIAVMTVQEGGVDFLGEVAGESEFLNKHLEQFFTPYPVARMMAEMQLFDMGEIIAERGFFTMQEPAAGAGVMVLATADVLQGMGFDPGMSMLVNAIDISSMAYHMCYLQLSWRGVSALVECRNALSDEPGESAYTPRAMEFYLHHDWLFGLPETDLRTEQLSLFQDLSDWVFKR